MLKEIGSIAVFIICAQTLLHFRAKESYEKYIKLLISMMLLLLLLKPFFAGEGKNGEAFLSEILVGYEKELEKNEHFGLGQENVEAVVMSMANEAIALEEARNITDQETTETGGITEETEEGNDMIQVERIQIGE